MRAILAWTEVAPFVAIVERAPDEPGPGRLVVHTTDAETVAALRPLLGAER
jgi:hypothetical protein